MFWATVNLCVDNQLVGQSTADQELLKLRRELNTMGSRRPSPLWNKEGIFLMIVTVLGKEKKERLRKRWKSTSRG